MAEMASRNLVASSKVRHTILAVGNPSSMQQIVVGRLKAGMIYAQAAKMITTVNQQSTTASPKGIDPALWAIAAGEPDLMAAMWKTGELTVVSGPTTYEMVGIVFDGDQINEVVEKWASPPDEWIQIKGGRPTAKWWSMFSVELARYVLAEGVPGDDSDVSITAVVAALQDRLAKADIEKGPDADSIRPTIELLIRRHLTDA
ncbi:hypothetical protein [Sphingomonas sp. CCH5-D11]|uniref:hypothetical protein n=1 Tax=Sphingomonas sp. CCH5-D11 TaxID=1768786 RepID=UPI00082DB35F|nr:hypothetical protein [Sphingomonas sp. CCH5-D11]